MKGFFPLLSTKVHFSSMDLVGSVAIRSLMLNMVKTSVSEVKLEVEEEKKWCINRLHCCKKRKSSRGLYLNSLAEEIGCCHSPTWKLLKEENNFSSLCTFSWLILYGVLIEIDHSVIVVFFLKGAHVWWEIKRRKRCQKNGSSDVTSFINSFI